MPDGLMWFRRDLRLHDNAALFHALHECDRVFCCFVFDREILDKLPDRDDRRVQFILQSINELDAGLKRLDSRLIIRHAVARVAIPRLAAELGVHCVYANHDYEPKRLERDAAVRKSLSRDNRELNTSKDHVVFEKDEVRSQSGRPYRVYTQYRNAWHAALNSDSLQPYDCHRQRARLVPPPARVKSDPWSLKALGFKKADLLLPGGVKAGRALFDRFLRRIRDYSRTRDIPAVDGTSRLSVHLRFGTVSVREVIREAIDEDSTGAKKWVDELVWREFYNTVLHHWPHTTTRAFQPAFDALPWRRDRRQFEQWCEGRTGYPIVDAGMRELNTTGYMHNRLRMITASFLTKDLRIDWRWGERYFARKLLDYDLSQNLGGWQWSAGIGADAQPWFRVFNPVTQSEKFDPQGEYIRRYVSELARFPDAFIHAPWRANRHDQKTARCRVRKEYPAPIVDHDEARKRAIAMFKNAKSGSKE